MPDPEADPEAENMHRAVCAEWIPTAVGRRPVRCALNSELSRHAGGCLGYLANGLLV